MMNKKHPAIILATWFGLGYMPKAPGTWGSLGALPLGLLILAFGGSKALLLSIFVIILIGLWASAHFERQSGEHDSKEIVIDEVAGLWIALLPAIATNPLHALIAFTLFRFFDVLKPWPINWVDKKVDGALGVMADDVLAGIAAALCLYGAHYAGLI